MNFEANERRVIAIIERMGEVATHHTRQANGSNEFGNTEWTWTADPDADGVDNTVLCYRTYDNRNTEVRSEGGDRHRDRPILMFTHDDWADIEANDRIEYPERDGSTTLYELQAPTRHPTHIEIPATIVTHQ